MVYLLKMAIFNSYVTVITLGFLLAVPPKKSHQETSIKMDFFQDLAGSARPGYD